jgi:hypothetical protein
MNCKTAVGMICSYLEGKLSPYPAAALRQHLSRCHDCALVLDAAQRTLEIYFDRGAEPVAAGHVKVA